jgi:hypothetical protein
MQHERCSTTTSTPDVAPVLQIHFAGYVGQALLAALRVVSLVFRPSSASRIVIVVLPRAMMLVREPDASILAVAATSARGSGCLSACITLLFCAVAVVGFWLRRGVPTAAPKAAVATTAETLETTPLKRSRLGSTRRFSESLDGSERRQLLRARRLKTGGNIQTLGARLDTHVAGIVAMDGPLKFLTVVELRVLLRSRGLRVNGLKQQLCERLAQHESPTRTVG